MKVINRVDYVYVPNASVRKTLVTYGYLKSTVNVLHNATDMLPIPNKQGAITYINQTYKINSAYFVILFVGRIIEVKNIMLIIRSLKILVEKNQQFQMVFIGDGSDRKKYENEINKLGLKSYCLFTGAINDSHILAKFYARANLLVVPSVFDNAPIVLLEAASQKTPTVCIRGSDAGSEIQDKKNGYLCNDDSVSLAKVLLYALKNISQNEECGINAYKTLYRS
jgi:glycosyltransferase involved in cell wall biosynthesis